MTACPVLVLRPEPGNAATLATARDLGLAARGFPLFEIAPIAWDCPDPAGFDAILAGSANVFRHGGPALSRLAPLPVHCVGRATAEAARAAGFRLGGVGEGGLQTVLDALPAGRFLRLAGAEHVALAPPAGTSLVTRVVYAAVPVPLPEGAAARLGGGALVLLHSGEAARHFAAECARTGIDRGRIALACLAPRIAGAAGSGWMAVKTASARTDAALLALAGQMCQNIRFGGSG